MSYRKKIRPVVLALLGVVLLPIFGEFFVEFAREKGWYKNPSEQVEGIMNFISTITNLPYFYHFVVFIAGLSMGVSVDLFLRKRETPDAVYVNKAELRLRTFDDNRVPERISHINIWRWYILSNVFVPINRDTGEATTSVVTNLFVTFDRPVRVGSLLVSSPDFSLPQYEVKAFYGRFAIVAFTGEMPTGTLVLRVRQ